MNVNLRHKTSAGVFEDV